MSQPRPINVNIKNVTINLAPPQTSMSGFGVLDLSGISRSFSTGPLDFGAKLADAVTEPAAASPTRLEWSPTLAGGERVNFKGAEEAIAKLNESLTNGEAQWRMPTRRELESIQDLTKHDPCVDLERYPDTKSGYYWSSTPCAWSSGGAWYVSFYDGYSLNGHRGNSDAFVRAVRAVPSGQ